MSEVKIARTTAEAEVGDLLWIESDIWRKSETILVPVRKVARTHLYAGTSENERNWYAYHRDTGAEKMSGGYSASSYARGWLQREARFWAHASHEMAKRITEERDAQTLKTVAFALGMEGPPDYSALPSTLAREQGGRRDGEG